MVARLPGVHALVFLGGQYHDFDGFGAAMQRLFEPEGASVEPTYDLDRLTRLDLAECQLVISYTCLTKNRPEGALPEPEKLTEPQIAGLTRWVRAGGGLLAVHSATVMGDSDATLGQLLGGVFISHPAPVPYKVIPIGAEHPITAGVSAFEIARDERYVTQHDATVTIHMLTEAEGEQLPQVWSKSEGAGRVAYVAPGHFPEVWAIPQYQQLLRQAAAWVLEKK